MNNDQIKALVKNRIAVFHNLELANSYADRCVKPHWVVLGGHDEAGENGEYWVVTPADAQRLERAGYEMI